MTGEIEPKKEGITTEYSPKTSTMTINGEYKGFSFTDLKLKFEPQEAVRLEQRVKDIELTQLPIVHCEEIMKYIKARANSASEIEEDQLYMACDEKLEAVKHPEVVENDN